MVADLGGVKTKPRTKLTLTKLSFVSPVDLPAQETATVAIIKRAKTGDTITATCRVAKVDDELGIVMGFAFTTTVDGKPYYDLQGDAIDEADIVKVAAEYMASGGYTDEMHDEEPDGRVVFCWPLTAEVAKALEITTKKTGLLVGIKPSPDVLAKFKSGEYTGFSIGGMGVRETAKAATSVCKGCSAAVDKSASYCPTCGVAMKSAPRDGVTLTIAPSAPTDAARDRAKKASAIVIDGLRRAELRKQRLAVAKDVVLTDEVDGHQHAIDLDDPAGWCGDSLQTTYATSEGADTGHSHVWTFDAATGAVTIAADSGHTHSVSESVPADVLAVFALNEKAEDAENATAVLERVLDGEPGAADIAISIAARAPREKSPPITPALKVGSKAKENTVDPKDLQIADLKKRAEHLERFATLTDAQRAYHARLNATDAEAFLAKSAADRDAAAKSAVVYTAKSGKAYYDADQAALAKQLDEQADDLAKARELAADADIEKRAIVMLEKFAGDATLKKRVMKALDREFTDKKDRDAVTAMLKSGSEALDRLFKSTDHRLRDGFELPADGATGDGAKQDDSPDVALRKHVEKYQADNKIPTYQQALHKAVREDAKTQELYAAAKN